MSIASCIGDFFLSHPFRELAVEVLFHIESSVENTEIRGLCVCVCVCMVVGGGTWGFCGRDGDIGVILGEAFWHKKP
jgi:hypothetical protein